MRRVYTDTSAIACLLKAEPHTHAMRLWLEAGECEVVSSDLLEIELRRLAVRLGRPQGCLLYTSPSPRDRQKSRMPSSA